MAAGNTDCTLKGGPHGRRRPRNDKKNEITVVGFLIRKDGSTVPMDEISPEEREEWLESCRRRLTQRMSDWFAQHPEELAKL